MAAIKLPSWEEYSFSKWLVRATEEYFKNPDVQKRFEAWQKEEEAKRQISNDVSDSIADSQELKKVLH